MVFYSLIFQILFRILPELAPANMWLPRLHGAGPSASLDESKRIVTFALSYHKNKLFSIFGLDYFV